MPLPAFPPASLDLLPGEAEHPPLRLLEPARRTVARPSARSQRSPRSAHDSVLRTLGNGLFCIVKLGWSK